MAVFDNVKITASGLNNSFAYSLWSRSKACTVFESGNEIDFSLWGF